MRDHQLAGFSRIFLSEGRAKPSLAPTYEGLMRAGALSWAQGDITLVRKPDPSRYGKFEVVGKVIGEEGSPEITLTSRYTTDLSRLFKLARRRCDFDLQIHMGECQDPRDFNRGWDKILIIEAARVTTYGTTDLGALEPGENAVVNEEVPVAGEDAIEIVPMVFSLRGGNAIHAEVTDVQICDTEACGECGIESDGCKIVLALSWGNSGSPGLVPSVAYTRDGGLSWARSDITTLASNENPNNSDCVGSNYVVVAEPTGSLHYIAMSDLLSENYIWTEVTNGFVANHGPISIHSVSSVHTWIGGAGGYIYFTEDPTSGVVVQEAGSASIQDVVDIHALDELRAVAVGGGNTVLFTVDGVSWGLVPGPVPGVNLSCVWMLDASTWLVGAENGRLYYTEDYGNHWAEKGFPGRGLGWVSDIKFFSRSVGYMTFNNTTPAQGRLLRTLDGGNSWYVLPERAGLTIPTNRQLNSIAVCADPNQVYAGGFAGPAIGGDGVLIKGSGS